MAGRLAVLAAALLLALVGTAFLLAAFRIPDQPTCKDNNARPVEEQRDRCYDGSSVRQSAQAVISGAVGGFALLALIPGLIYVFQRRMLIPFIGLTGLAVGLAAVYVVAGKIG